MPMTFPRRCDASGRTRTRSSICRAFLFAGLCASLGASNLASAQSERGVALHGFADVGAGWSSGDDPGKLSIDDYFRILAFDLKANGAKVGNEHLDMKRAETLVIPREADQPDKPVSMR